MSLRKSFKVPSFLDTENFAPWLSVPGGPTREDKQISSHLTAISQPQSKFHGLKAIKILEFFTDFDIITIGAQVLAIQGFTDAVREKRDDKTFTNKKSNEVDEYLKLLKKQIANFSPSERLTPFRGADIPVTEISSDELSSKTGEDAYKCTICRLPFDIDNVAPPAEPTPKERQRIKSLANESLKAAKGNSGPEEDRVLQELTSFATDLARLCVVPQNRSEAPEKEKRPKDARDLEKSTDLKSLLAQIESYRCTEPILTECGHAFGVDCLLQWITEQDDNVQCPYCRKTLSRKAPNHRNRGYWHDIVGATGTANAGSAGASLSYEQIIPSVGSSGTSIDIFGVFPTGFATQSSHTIGGHTPVAAQQTAGPFTQSSSNHNGIVGPSYQGSSMNPITAQALLVASTLPAPHPTHATPVTASAYEEFFASHHHQWELYQQDMWSMWSAYSPDNT